MEEPGRNRLFLNQYTFLLTAVTHGRARKKLQVLHMEEPGRNRLFLNQYTCLLTAVTHGRARKKNIIPKPIHMSTYSSYTWKSQEETYYS